MKSILIVATLIFIGISCNSVPAKTATIKDSTALTSPTDTSMEIETESQAPYREEFIASYDDTIKIDTSFTINEKRYRVLIQYYCTFDSSIIVPASYNFDTNKDFITHSFASELKVESGGEIILTKKITKSDFNSILADASQDLNEYSVLLPPNFELIENGFEIHYSLSIPATDIGIPVRMGFNEKSGLHVLSER